MKRLLAVIVAGLALAGAGFFDGLDAQAAPPQFGYQYTSAPAVSAAVSRFVHKPIAVNYEIMAPGLYGYTWLNGDEIFISHRFANPLNALAGGEYVSVQRQGIGVETLAHEALHTIGLDDEAKTECWALQLADDLMREFGVSEAMIPVLWHHAYEDNVKFFRNPTYWNARFCRPNGRWDRTPNDGTWP